jgi:surface protein
MTNKITTKQELRDLILSGIFHDPAQVQNDEHICKDGSIYDYSEISNFSYMLSNSSLITMPLLDTSNVLDMYAMFRNCKSLTSIPLLDTSNVLDMHAIFSKCYSLSKTEQVKFFYSKNKFLLQSLELNSNLFSEQKLNELLDHYS